MTWPDDVIDPADVPVPGSRPRVQHVPRTEPARGEQRWDAHPKHYRVNGHDMELFDVRALCIALGRDQETIKSWERKVFFPATDIRAPRKGRQQMVTKDNVVVTMRGKRLYPRAFIEGCIVIAKETGVDRPGAVIDGTDFPARVFELWEECYPA